MCVLLDSPASGPTCPPTVTTCPPTVTAAAEAAVASAEAAAAPLEAALAAVPTSDAAIGGMSGAARGATALNAMIALMPAVARTIFFEGPSLGSSGGGARAGAMGDAATGAPVADPRFDTTGDVALTVSIHGAGGDGGGAVVLRVFGGAAFGVFCGGGLFGVGVSWSAVALFIADLSTDDTSRRRGAASSTGPPAEF